jgi:hypothetical protein
LKFGEPILIPRNIRLDCEKPAWLGRYQLLLGSVKDVEIWWTGGGMDAPLDEHRVRPRKAAQFKRYNVF